MKDFVQPLSVSYQYSPHQMIFENLLSLNDMFRLVSYKILLFLDDNGGGCLNTKTRGSSRERTYNQEFIQCETAASTVVRNSAVRDGKGVAKSTRQRSESHLKSDLLCKIAHQAGHSPTSVCSFCCSRYSFVPRHGNI